MLTPKIGTEKGLTCGPSLVKKRHSAGKSPQRIRQRYLRSAVRHHSAEGLFALEEGSIREYVMTWPGYKERTNWWRVRDGHWRRDNNLGNKCCTRSRPGVVLGQGYKYKPLMSVIGIGQLHNKTDPVPTYESFSRVVEFFERNHRFVDLRKYRQPCIMSSIMRWI
jgi:hypothetical protein